MAVSSTRTSSPRQASSTSSRSKKSEPSSSRTTEETPLLGHRDESPSGEDGRNGEPSRSGASNILRSIINRKPIGTGKSGRRWPSIIALVVLSIFIIVIIILGFLAPAAVEEYAMQAMVFNPTNVSVHSFTAEGVEARIQGDFMMNGSRVHKKPTRDLGRFGTWIAGQAESGWADLEMVMPAYDGVVLGKARIPPVKVSIRDGYVTHVDVPCNFYPGDLDGMKTVAGDWIHGRMGNIEALAKASVPLKSGIINLGTKKIEEWIPLSNGRHGRRPSMPEYNVTSVQFHEITLPSRPKGMAADVSLSIRNDYPLHLIAPPLGFAIMAAGCSPNDYIMVADATTGYLGVQPYRDIHLNVTGKVRQIPKSFRENCPGTNKSPMDRLLGNYLHGKNATVYVRGSDSPSTRTPPWITDVMSDVTVPLPVPGRSFGHLIKNFSLADVHFNLPDPEAEPGTPESKPKISALVKAIVALPKEMKLNVSVDAVKADADVFYHGDKLGSLNLDKWQKANSTPIEGVENGILVESAVENAPLNVTDDALFTEVVEALIFNGKPLKLGIKAQVDVKLDTALGELAARNIPAEGVVKIKPIRKGGWGADLLNLHVGNLSIVDTTEDTLTLEAQLNFTNPTPYSAVVPYVDINILTNETILGHVTARDISVVPGNNTGVIVQAIWDPLSGSGKKGLKIGRELLSQYISGYNTSLTLKTHAGSIPSQPALGKALEQFELEFPTPRLKSPPPPDGDGDGDGRDDDGPHFIADATVLPTLIEILSSF